MGDLTLDILAEGSLPLHNIDGHYLGAFRSSLRLCDEVTPNFTLVGGPAFQVGQENALTDAKVRRFRLQPDPRLLGHFKSGSEDFRLDVPELYFQYTRYTGKTAFSTSQCLQDTPQDTSQWKFQVGRNLWDNTLQSRFHDWSYAGFTDNLADAGISIGPVGGNVSFHKPATPDSPTDVQLSASAALGGRNEGLGLIQGLSTFATCDAINFLGSLFGSKFCNRDKMSDWVTVVGGSLGLSYYPEGALPALLSGIPTNAAGGGLSVSGYWQQGIGRNFDAQAGYDQFIPIIKPGSSALAPLKPRKAFNFSVDFHIPKTDWGLRANYGRVWRDDLAGVTGTKKENQFDFSVRWMIPGDENRVLNLIGGVIFMQSNQKIDGGAYAAIELNLQGLALGKL